MQNYGYIYAYLVEFYSRSFAGKTSYKLLIHFLIIFKAFVFAP